MFRSTRAERGATLVELTLMIVVVGVVGGFAVGVLGSLARQTQDPIVQRQALVAAEAMLAEVLAQGTQALDPDGGANGLGPEAGESRLDAAQPFDHVDDYHGYSQTGLTDLDGTPLAGLQAYSVAVTVQPQALAGVASSDGWWVTVQATGPGNPPVTLSAWRARLTP